jgi:hypothetical protein
MKIFKSLTIGLFCFSLGSAFAEPAPTPQIKKVLVTVSEAFVPSGFDSNTEAFVVASGVFPNGCYAWSEAKVNNNKDNNVIEISVLADVTQGMCIMVLVPFNKEIRLGKLTSGEHTIRFINGDGTYLEKTIKVE